MCFCFGRASFWKKRCGKNSNDVSGEMRTSHGDLRTWQGPPIYGHYSAPKFKHRLNVQRSGGPIPFHFGCSAGLLRRGSESEKVAIGSPDQPTLTDWYLRLVHPSTTCYLGLEPKNSGGVNVL